MHEIKRAGITFDVKYYGGSHGGPTEQPYGPEIEVQDWRVYDWDELAEMHGAKGDRPIIRASLDEIVEEIANLQMDSMFDDIEAERDSDFDPPDDGDYCYDPPMGW